MLIIAIVLTAITITILIAVYHAKKITTEIKSEEDHHNTPHFSRRAGEGLENIKKYGIWL